MRRLLALSFTLLLPGASNLPFAREARSVDAREFANAFSAVPQQVSDDALASVRRLDRAGRGANGTLPGLSSTEHLRRANIYFTNRAFAEAREHWQAIVALGPNDPNVAPALFGIGRSYFQDRRYAESLPFFERAAREYPQTKDGREALNSSAAALLRMGRANDSVARYVEYTEKYPQGERIESAYLNIIDSLREAGRPQEAIEWVARTRQRFAGKATDTNALFARLRLDVAEGEWQHAVQTADELRAKPLFQTGVLTILPEVLYLKAYSLERAGRKDEAFTAYLAIPDGIDSYYGGLATARLLTISDASRRTLVNERVRRTETEIAAASELYPVPFREAILRTSQARKLDPRLILAIMRQESHFNPRAKSPASARGLLQLTIDAATKYSTRAGLRNLQELELYRPETNIMVGGEYIAELTRLFPNLPEAVAASYNGGEDNVARWVRRARQTDAGVFTAEVGFSETKDYVFKVMSNYRAYRQLYNVNLIKQ